MNRPRQEYQVNTSATPEKRGDKAQKLILQALHDCIIAKGYAKTTLADIAKLAGMYASHLLYYFDGKDGILEQYFQNVAEQFVERIGGFRADSPERQIDLIADVFFAGHGFTKSEIGFMLECFGAAVNDAVLKREKTEFDRWFKSYLTELFEQTPRGFVSGSRDSAEVAFAMLIGLRTAVYFDERLELRKAHRLFRTTMRTIAGFDQ